jgi:predicted acylesterase/phospholipase RssA
VSLSLTLVAIAAGIVTGAVAALVLQFLIELAAARLSCSPAGSPQREPAAPFWIIARADRALKEAAVATPPPALNLLRVGAVVARLFGNESGYVETLPNGRHRILPGHTFAVLQLVVTVALFFGILYFKQNPADPSLSASDTEAAFWAQTVTSILLLLLLIGWTLSGTAFFFDRYRTPLLTIALAAALTTGTWKWTDYRVATTGSGEEYMLATPGQVLRAFGEQPLVVAAAGGGIQAGAWTARVLLELDDHLNHTLRTRLAMISAVSGGSMGALYYGASEGQSLRSAADQALKSSLDEIAAVALSRDTLRMFGASPALDRGAALERSWEERLPESQRQHATLRTWSERARGFANGFDSPPFPAFLFNSTIVEHGQPMAFATTQFPTHTYRMRVGPRIRPFPAVESANRVLRLSARDDATARDVGLKAVTAARLSAAFPYVSPAATLDLAGVEPLHLVDGGYYDNYGLVALTQWLDDALEELSEQVPAALPRTVGVVVATGLVSSDSAVSLRLRGDDGVVPPLDKTVALHGWFWQLLAPPTTALNAGSFAQRAGGLQTFQLLVDKWAGRVTIVPHVFSYPGGNTDPVCQASPLSWKLTATQQECIDRAWKTFKPHLAAMRAL